MWKDHASNIRRHIATESIENFLNWSTVKATMFVGSGADYIEEEYKELTAAGWTDIIKEPGHGNPELFNGTSGNMIRQAYHIKKWMDHTGLSVKDFSCIREIGGGYGAMRLIIDRLGFCGRYVIDDLPEVTYIQRYYTEKCGLQTEFNTHCKPDLLISCFALSEVPLNERKTLIGSFTPNHHLIAFQGVWDGVDNMNYFNYGKVIEAAPKGCFYMVR